MTTFHRPRRLVVAGLAAVVFALVVGLARHRPPQGKASHHEPSAAPPMDVVTVPIEVPPEAPLTPKRRRLYVEVLSADHVPIAGARVHAVSPLEKREMLTDARGLAVLEDVPATLARLSAGATGYKAQTFIAPKLPSTEEVAWTFLLSSDSTIDDALRGAVLVGGAPIPNGLVVFFPRDDRARLSPAHLAITDDTGRFLADSSLADIAQVAALHDRHGLVVVPIASEQELTLELPPGGFLEGQVVDEAGRPVTAFDLRVDAERGTDVLRRALGAFWRLPRDVAKSAGVRAKRLRVTGLLRPHVERVDKVTNGRFRVGPHAPGKISLTAHAPSKQPTTLELSLPSDELLSGLVLRLERPLLVTGRVTDEATKAPIPGAMVRAEGGDGVAMPGFGEALTDENGAFRLHAPAGVRHSLAVQARGYLPLDIGGIEGRSGTEVQRDVALRRADASASQRREYVGVGAALRPDHEGARVAEVFEDGPAFGRLSPGDTILRVDGVWVKGRSLREIVQRIVGEAGTEVELLIRRAGQSHTERVALPRQRISTSG